MRGPLVASPDATRDAPSDAAALPPAPSSAHLPRQPRGRGRWRREIWRARRGTEAGRAAAAVHQRKGAASPVLQLEGGGGGERGDLGSEWRR